MTSSNPRNTARAYRARTLARGWVGAIIYAALVSGVAGAQSGTVMPAPKYTAFDNAGNPISGGKLCVYIAGTTTPSTTYTDVTLSVPNSNPVIADAAGRMTVFLSPGSSYKFVLRTAGSDTTCATGSILWTQDNVLATPSTSANLDVLGTVGETVAAGQVVYLSDGSGGKTPGQWYLANATNTYSATTPIIGIAPTGIASGASGTVRLRGTVSGLSALTVGAQHYVSASVSGAVTATPPTNRRVVGSADTTTSLILSDGGEVYAPNITSGTLAAARATTVLTTTSTGTQNDFNPGTLTGPLVLLRCNNASLLTLTGLVAGADGQVLIVASVGAGQVDLSAQNAGSSAANRFQNVASGLASLAPNTGVAVYQYDGTAARWRMLSHDQGAWIDYAGTSTVAGWASFTTKVLRYKLVGRTLHVTWYLDGTSNSTLASFTLPYVSFSGANVLGAQGRTFDNGAYVAAVGAWQMPAGSSAMTLQVNNNPTTVWTNINQKISAGVAAFEVQ